MVIKKSFELDKNLILTPDIDYKKCFHCDSEDFQFERINEPDSFESYEQRTCCKCNAEWCVNHFSGEIYYTLTKMNFKINEDINMKRILSEELKLTDKKLGDYVVTEKYILQDDIKLVGQDIKETIFEVTVRDKDLEYDVRTLHIDNESLELNDFECEVTMHLDIDKMDLGLEYFDFIVLTEIFPLDEQHSFTSFKHFLGINDSFSFDQDILDQYYIESQNIEDEIIYKVVNIILENYKTTIQQNQ